MKTYVELGLAALLAVFIYEKPHFLLKIVDNTLGKFLMVLLIAIIAKQFGINAGLLAAVIFIVLQESNKENFKENMIDCGKCDEKDKECWKTCNVSDKDNKQHGDDGKERMTNINGKLQPADFPVTGTDQIGRDRMVKINALNSKNAASQQANGQTNNGGGLSF